jgi:hypothetical protein
VTKQPTESTRYAFRIPTHVRKRIEAAAKSSGNSLNEEMVLRLEESFRREDAQKIAERAAEVALKKFITKGSGG